MCFPPDSQPPQYRLPALSDSGVPSPVGGLIEIAGLDNGVPDIDGRIPLPSKVKQ